MTVIPDGEIDYEQETSHDPDDIVPDEYTIEGDALNKALARSTFDTTNALTSGGDDHKHEHEVPIPSTINYIDTPLGPVNHDQKIQHVIVDEDDEIIDEFTNHTYDEILNLNENPNEIDKDLRLEQENENDLVPLIQPQLQPKPLKELYKHTHFINTNAQMELELLSKHLKRMEDRIQYPKPHELHKTCVHDPMRKALYPVQIDEEVIQSIRHGAITANEILTEFKRIMKKYQNTIAKEWADCGKIEGVYLKLDLKPGATPFKYAPYKTAYEQMDEIERQINKLLAAGFIRPSNSNYASPVLMVPKKQIGDKLEWRMCIDYRKLNSMTIKDHYPLPNIQSLYRKFAGNKIFSSLDLRHAYHHIGIRPEDRHKTAFITHKGLFEWIRMTFGFANAPAAFQRAVNYIFRDLEFVIVYLDDILVLSKSQDEHVKHLRIVFKRLAEYDLKIRLDKCHFFQRELKYLGFILNEEGVKPDPEYVDKIIALQTPDGKPSLLRALGMINWLHRYIPRLSDYTWPLNRLTRKNVKFDWEGNPECQIAFDKIKDLVRNARILKHPDLSKPFYVVCDASNFGIGSVLMQKHGQILEPCEFWSRLFSDSEKHWHVSEKELFAIVASLEKWSKYLLGKHFYVYTDHKNLEILHTKHENQSLTNSKLIRWLLRIEQFDFTCYYIEGIINVVADYLSRDICMTNITKQRDSINNDQTMYYSVLLKKQNSNYFINNNHCLENTNGICLVRDFDGTVKKLHTLSKHHIFNVLRRSPRLLAKKQKKEALAEFRRISRPGNNEQRNLEHQAITATTNKSTVGNAGRSLQAHSDRVGNAATASRAPSDGFGSFSKNVMKSPLSVNIRSSAKGRDVIDGANDDFTIDTDSKVASIDERPSKESVKQNINSKQNRIVVHKFKNISDDLKKVEQVFDFDFSRIINVDSLREQLLNDSVYGSIYLLLSNKTDQSLLYTLAKPYRDDVMNKNYIIKNQLLYYIPKRAYIIPPRLRHPVLSYFHKSIVTLHQGIQRMMKLMQNRVYWKGIRKDIERFISECESCQLAKATPNKREGYMQLFEPQKPFEVVHMDIVGSLPVTRTGNRYILTMMDRYSRLIKLVAIPVMTAKCIAMAFRNNWLLQFGVPDNVLTDRGSYFTGLIMSIVSKMFGFKNLFTTSYHPKTNGRLERFHRYLKQRLRVIAHELKLDFNSSDDWDVYLPNIAFSYNICPNHMTKYSPYDIIYPNLIKLPIDRLLKINVDEVVQERITTLKNPTDRRLKALKLDAEHRAGITELKKHRENLKKEIAAVREKYNKKRKELYDKSRVAPTHYKDGQEVWIDISVGKVGNARKLGINRKRGHILDKLSQNAYIVKFDDGKVEPINVDRLYTLSKSCTNKQNKIIKRGKNNHRNYKRRERKRKIKNSNKNVKYPPHKRRRTTK